MPVAHEQPWITLSKQAKDIPVALGSFRGWAVTARPPLGECATKYWLSHRLGVETE